MTTNNVNFRVKNGLEVALNVSIAGTIQASSINTSAITTGLGYTPLNKAGDTLTGNLACSTGSAYAALSITANAGVSRSLFYTSNGGARWELKTNTTAESGSNAGSDFVIFRYADNASVIDAPLSIIRSTGVVAVGILTATSINSSAITNGLGYTPVSKAGDAMYGNLSVGSNYGAISANAALSVVNGNNSLAFVMRNGNGGYNPISQSNDSLMYFTAGTYNTGSLVIAPWSTIAGGLRMDSYGNTALTGNLTLTGNLGVASAATFSSTVGIAGLLTVGTINATTLNFVGSTNLALGSNALVNSTGSNANTALGSSALNVNTSGANNTGIGATALYNNINGSNNTAVGQNSGRLYNTTTPTPLTTINNSIFIGYNTQALANGDTNEIVIGYNSTGLGSNTTNIGNSSTTLTGIYGNVSISGSLNVTAINSTPIVNALQPVPVSTIVTTANSTLSLTLATHNNTIIVLSTGTILNINYANLANGFTCTLINNTGADLTPTLTGFTATTITNSVGAPKLSNNGMATILAYTPDGGTTKICRVAGEVTF